VTAPAARQRVAVVTGGAAGIGAAIAEALGREGAFVVTVDPGVALDGSPQSAGSEHTTAQRIVDAGGQARASSVSVTDGPAVRALFAELVDELGSLDAVVNVAGISRSTGFAHGVGGDWQAVLGVHLDGYLNVLGAALPIMAAAGRGRIVGVTSGSGWRAADAGAYSCAKRAVAALTWQVGRAAPPGVTVNALSPIAATRMVAAALSRQAEGGNTTGRSAASGGVSLGAGVPPPEHLGPVGAYLASDRFSWCNGQVMFSNGSEIAWVAPPHLLEVAPTDDIAALPALLEALGPIALLPAEAAQATNGGGNPRVGALSGRPAPASHGAARAARCAIVTDSPAWGEALAAAVTARGAECVGVGAWQGSRPGPLEPARDFAPAAEQLASVADSCGPIDAVVVALAGRGGPAPPEHGDAPAWRRVLEEHAGITDHIRTDAAWARSVADYAAATGRPVRLCTIVDASTAGGWGRGQAAGQLARSARSATSDRVDAFAISVETAERAAHRPVAEVAAYLVCAADTGLLSGAEFVADAGWFALRSHPNPVGTISYGGPGLPDWLDGALRDMVAGRPHPPRP